MSNYRVSQNLFPTVSPTVGYKNYNTKSLSLDQLLKFRRPLLPSFERVLFTDRCRHNEHIVTDMMKLVGRLVSVHRLVLFLSDVCHFSGPPLVHSVVFSVDHLGTVPVYDVVERWRGL